MTRDEAKAEVAQLLLERAEQKRLGLSLPPDKLMLLKRLMYRLGMTNVKLQRRENLLRLARRLGVKRYAEPVQPTPSGDPFDQWRNAKPQAPKKISTALKALHEKSALIPVTDEPLPVVRTPPNLNTFSGQRAARYTGHDDDERNVPGGFDLHDRHGRRQFMEYLRGTGEDSDLQGRVQQYIDHDVDNYEPDIDDSQLREAAVENNWTPQVMAETIAGEHPEAAEAVHQFNQVNSYRPNPQQRNLFDPSDYGDRSGFANLQHTLQDQLASPDDTDYEDRLMDHLRTYHPNLNHRAINATLNWLARDRLSDMDSARDDLYDQERRWYAENYDSSDIENEILQQMHDEMDQQGRWDDEPEPEPEPDEGWDQVRQEIAEARASGQPLSEYHQGWADLDPERNQLPAAQPAQLPAPAIPEPPKALPEGPQYGRWYGDHAVHTYRFKTPSGRPFSIDIGHYNQGGSKVDNLTFNDDRHSYDDTGKGEAKAVFDQVSTAVAAYMKAKKPDVLTFSAATTDGTATEGKSRQNLYTALIKHLGRLDPNYAAGEVAMPGGGKNFFVFDRTKVDNVAKLVQEKLGGTQHTIRPIILKRKGPIRFAKVDSHVQAHPLVQGFPIENFLRHLANDPNNHPTIRELAKVAVTGGKDNDASNVPTALWALHESLHEHKHPLKDAYNLMSAGDKIGLDAHVGRAVREIHEDHVRQMPDANAEISWERTPDGILNQAVAGSGKKRYPGDAIGWHKAVRNRVHERVKQLSPMSSEQDIDESIRRHAHRSLREWASRNSVSGFTPDRDLVKWEPDHGTRRLTETGQLNEQATRYRRLVNKLRYALNLGEGVPGKHLSGEDMFTHGYEGGVMRVIPRNEGKSLHVDYVGPEDASPGDTDHLNKLGVGNVRSLHEQLIAKYPSSQFLTGIRPKKGRVVKEIPGRFARFEGQAQANMSPEKIQFILAHHQGMMRAHENNIRDFTDSGHLRHAQLANELKFHHLAKFNSYWDKYAHMLPPDEKYAYENTDPAPYVKLAKKEHLDSVKNIASQPKKLGRNKSPKTGELIRYKMVAGDFMDALQRIRSSDQQSIRKSMEEIAAKLGAKPASTVDALHDSPHYSVPGVAMAIYSNLSPEKVHALAAWSSLTQNTPGNAVFHVRPDGPDMLHRFRMQGSGHELRARLDKAGLDSRILVPHKTGFDVLIPDKGGALRDRVKGFAQQQKTELQSSRGHFKMIGSSDQARAREMFRNAITKQEHSETPDRKSDNSPPPSIPQGPPAGPGPGADLPSSPVYRASRLRRIMERIKRV